MVYRQRSKGQTAMSNPKDEKSGLGSAIIDKAREEIKDLQADLKNPQQTQLWKSIFRVKHERTDTRNRALAVLSNVFLHLHPARVNRDAVRYGYTWGMGGITFYLFIVLVFGPGRISLDALFFNKTASAR